MLSLFTIRYNFINLKSIYNIHFSIDRDRQKRKQMTDKAHIDINQLSVFSLSMHQRNIHFDKKIRVIELGNTGNFLFWLNIKKSIIIH